MTTSILAALERAELESRARRLAAQAEADHRIAVARATAEEIAATREQEVAAALAGLRARYRESADAEIADADAELARLESPAAERPDAGPGFESAVAAIVAAVLGETEA
jgi:hypothetical protein